MHRGSGHMSQVSFIATHIFLLGKIFYLKICVQKIWNTARNYTIHKVNTFENVYVNIITIMECKVAYNK